MWKNIWLKELAGKYGLEKGKSIIVEERSLLKDYTYITREIRHGVVLELYPHHFYCQMENGRRESFRYNEFLGHEARLVHLKEEQQKSVQAWTLFLLRKESGSGNVKKCAVGKHPKSEKLGSTGQAACCARIHSRYFTGGSPSGLRV